MPTQLPLESTDLFGDLLFPHTFDILQSDAKKPLESHNFSFPVHSVIEKKKFIIKMCRAKQKQMAQLQLRLMSFLTKMITLIYYNSI